MLTQHLSEARPANWPGNPTAQASEGQRSRSSLLTPLQDTAFSVYPLLPVYWISYMAHLFQYPENTRNDTIDRNKDNSSSKRRTKGRGAGFSLIILQG